PLTLSPCISILNPLHANDPHLHSFPTRRSSDLAAFHARSMTSGTPSPRCHISSSASYASPSGEGPQHRAAPSARRRATRRRHRTDRKSTRLNSSHVEISYAVFCLKKKSSD